MVKTVTRILILIVMVLVEPAFLPVKLVFAEPTVAEKRQARISENKSKWRKLETGMSYSQVRMLLGEPFHIEFVMGDQAWFYGNGGHVVFRTVPKEGSVESWAEPDDFDYVMETL